MAEFEGELIIKYLDNNISEAEEQILLDWIKSSDENREIFLTCKKIYALGKIHFYSNSNQLNTALESFHNRTNAFKITRTRQLIKSISKYAAVFAFLIAISAGLFYIFKTKPAKYTTLLVEKNDPVRTITLADGTKVWVNSLTSFSYPEEFKGKERVVTLNGEAFFEVKTDLLRPFIVKTNGMQVRVHGTTFNINTNNTDGTIKTTLVSGSVAISDNKGADLVTLVPGQLAVFNKTNKEISLNNVNTDLYTSWHKGLYIFYKSGLEDIVTKIEEVYQINITINYTKPIQNKINFVFRKTQPFDTVMEMLKFVIPIEYKKYNEQVYINLK